MTSYIPFLFGMSKRTFGSVVKASLSESSDMGSIPAGYYPTAIFRAWRATVNSETEPEPIVCFYIAALSALVNSFFLDFFSGDLALTGFQLLT